jgi:glutathione peroxidase-family protein
MKTCFLLINGENQHPLFKWLTHLNKNTHFDRDVEETGQLFIISKKGTLYGILGRQVSTALVMEA